MNNKTKAAATLPLGGGSYESPVLNVVELETEGVLCASGGEGVFDEFYEQGI